MAAFQQVVTVDEVDTLCGSPLRHGDKLILRWPDSSSSTHTATVVETPTDRFVTKSVDGKRKKIPIVRSEAHVYVKHRGVELKVTLSGSGLFVARDE